MFKAKDTAEISFLHDNVIVIVAMIGNYNIRRILIDIGNFADILYATTYNWMKLEREKIADISTRLIGFTGH